MDPRRDQDTLMHDGDIIETTEFASRITQTQTQPEIQNADSQVKLGLETHSSSLPSTNGGRPPFQSAAPLKGSGLKREVTPPDHGLMLRKDGPKPAKFAALPYSTSQTGLVYDVRMRFHVESEPSEDDLHPEDPRRIHAIFEAFVNGGLVWSKERDTGASNAFYMGRIDTRKVTKEEVLLVHSERHWEWVQSLVSKTSDQLKIEKQHPPLQNDSIYLSATTPYCAALSAGGAIEACRAIILGKVKNVFAVIRPPGHHAEREDAKGFCFYDNVSIAAKVCQKEFCGDTGPQCRKVFILDWDVHHGNGIQQANYDDPNVLYISLHVHMRGKFYPEGSYRDDRPVYGDHLHCGEGAGLGTNVNIPWSRRGMGDADYIYAFQQVIMPIATEFNPDLVIIAAGFDAAEGDMLGGCHVTPAGYAHMTHMLMSLADGKVAVCLEGGYNLNSIARSALAVGRTLMGEPPDRLSNLTPTNSGVDDVKLVQRQHSRFWASLYPKDISARLNGPLNGERMHNVVRRWQAETLYDEYSMHPLFINRERLAKEFEHQVLATPNYMEARPLLIIMHDPPEMIASPDPRTGKIELHNTWVTDIVKTYIKEAVNNKFAVIDVNLPKHITDASDTHEHQDSQSPDFRIREATELLTYLWDNYIELSDSTHIFLLGTNIGHGAITNFIKANEDRAQRMITKAISFVEDVPLLSCKSQTNDYLPNWYYSSSMVFLTEEHGYFSSEIVKKPKKRFGNITRAKASSISDMLLEAKDLIFESLLDETEEWRGKESSEDDMDTSSSLDSPPRKLPPVGNFAISPKKTPGAGAGNGNRSPTKAGDTGTRPTIGR